MAWGVGSFLVASLHHDAARPPAAIPGVAVLLVWCEWLPWGRGYCAHVQALPALLPTSPEAAAAQVNMLMEQVVLQAPSQYLWGYAAITALLRAHVLMTNAGDNMMERWVGYAFVAFMRVLAYPPLPPACAGLGVGLGAVPCCLTSAWC